MQPEDRVFGEASALVVAGGAADFREVPGPDPRRKVYLHGEWLGSDLHARVAADDLEDGHGRFVVLVHDLQANRLVVQNDRYGMASLFRVDAGGRVHLGTRMKPLLERGLSQRRLDAAGLADALAFNVPFGSRTLVADVGRLAPGTRLAVDLAGGAAREERRWSPERVMASEQVPYESLREALVARFLEGFDRCIAGEARVGITLSGGIDSRCLLAAGLDRGAQLAAFNASIPGSRSGRYAAQMAARFDVPYEAHPVGPEFAESYPARLREVMAVTEGMTFASEVEARWLSQHVSGPTVMLHGAFGEVSKLFKMLQWRVDGAVLGATRANLADVVWRRFDPMFRANLALFSPEIRAATERHAREELGSRIDAIDPAFTPAMVMLVLYVEEFVSKITPSSAKVWNQSLPTRFPFAYPPFVDTLLRVRSEDKMQQRFQMDLLKGLSPELFRFPDANTGTRVDAPVWLSRLLDLSDKARRVLFASQTTLDHSDRPTWFTRMRPSAEELLLSDDARQVFDPAAVERAIAHVVGREGAPGFGPVAAIRHRIARVRTAVGLEKALLFQLFREHAGLGAP